MRANKWMTNTASLMETSDVLTNPGCGWYEIHSFWAEKEVLQEEIRACLSQEDCLVLVRIHLGAYTSRPLDERAISNICKILTVFEQAQKDVILRCCYDFEGKGMEHEPALFSQVRVHMKQVAEVVAMYDKVVYVYQGLLIGSWGEMHTSKFLLADRLKELADVLADETKCQVWHAVRTPTYWQQLVGTTYDMRGATEKKVTIFDDGIFGSSTHLGTVEEPKQLELLEKLSTMAPYGGEVVNSAEAMKRSLPETIIRLQQLQVSYLNRRHDEMLLRYWESQFMKTKDVWNGMNGREYIGRHLGYRFHIRKVEEEKVPSELGQIGLKIYLENEGFSDVYEEVKLAILHKTMDGMVKTVSCQSVEHVCAGGTEMQFVWKLPRKTGSYYITMHRAKDMRQMYFANPAEQNGWVKLGTIT